MHTVPPSSFHYGAFITESARQTSSNIIRQSSSFFRLALTLSTGSRCFSLHICDSALFLELIGSLIVSTSGSCQTDCSVRGQIQCDQMQGCFVSAPVSAEEFADLISRPLPSFQIDLERAAWYSRSEFPLP